MNLVCKRVGCISLPSELSVMRVTLGPSPMFCILSTPPLIPFKGPFRVPVIQRPKVKHHTIETQKTNFISDLKILQKILVKLK